MIEINVVCGDGDGGSHLHSRVGLGRADQDEVTDEQLHEIRGAAVDLLRAGFSREPEQVIVYIEDKPG